MVAYQEIEWQEEPKRDIQNDLQLNSIPVAFQLLGVQLADFEAVFFFNEELLSSFKINTGPPELFSGTLVLIEAM